MNGSFQARVGVWMEKAFTREVIDDVRERNHRFLEEACELVQSLGLSRVEAHLLVNYVYDRPVGDPKQEVGGTQVTLAALCNAHAFDMVDAADRELARCWDYIEKIRARQLGKPRHAAMLAARPITNSLEEKLAVLVRYLQQVRGGYRQANPLGVNSLLDDAELNNWVDQMNRDGKIPPRL